MSDIRFNQWLHNSGTGGVSQVDGGHVGIGTTNPLIPVGAGVTAILNVGVVTANSYYGDGSNLSGIVGGGTSLSFNDNIGAYFGNSQDLKIYHDGNHSYIDDQGTGNLRLRSGTLEILNLAGNKTSATFSSGGGQTLNFNNSAKFVTTNTGAVVTGILTATSINSTGYMGAGTNNPQARLEVKDGANNYGTTIRLSQGYNSVFSEIASNFGGSMTLNAGEGTTTAIMHFQVNNSEKMRLNNSGQLLVGTTSATSLGSHTGASNVSTFNQSGITLTQYGVTTGFYYDRLNFTNSQYFIVNSSSTGVYLGNGSTSWTAYSDERLKTNITELDGTKAYNHVKTARAASF